jgi:hypothetical protein
MIEPDRVGSLWRERFNPEDHHKDGIVGRLVRNRTKRFLLESQGRVESDGRDFDYWALVRIVARRLLRAGNSKSYLRPSRPLYEAFKEVFFFQGKSTSEATIHKAWFFLHVRQVVMRVKHAYVRKSYRPWEDPLIDMGESTGEEEEDEAYVVKDREDGEEEGRSTFLRKRKNSSTPTSGKSSSTKKIEKKRIASSSEEEDEKHLRSSTDTNDKRQKGAGGKDKATMPPPSGLGTRKQPLSFPASKLPFTTPAAPETPFIPTPSSSRGSQEKRKVPGSSHSKASGSRFDGGDGADYSPEPTDGGDGDDGVDDSLSHSPVSKGGETTSPVPDIPPVRRGGGF